MDEAVQPAPAAPTQAVTLQARMCAMHNQHELILLEELRALPPSRLAGVEDFVDFLRSRDQDQRLIQAAAAVAEGAFQKVWDNSDDAPYDRL